MGLYMRQMGDGPVPTGGPGGKAARCSISPARLRRRIKETAGFSVFSCRYSCTGRGGADNVTCRDPLTFKMVFGGLRGCVDLVAVNCATEATAVSIGIASHDLWWGKVWILQSSFADRLDTSFHMPLTSCTLCYCWNMEALDNILLQVAVTMLNVNSNSSFKPNISRQKLIKYMAFVRRRLERRGFLPPAGAGTGAANLSRRDSLSCSDHTAAGAARRSSNFCLSASPIFSEPKLAGSGGTTLSAPCRARFRSTCSAAASNYFQRYQGCILLRDVDPSTARSSASHSRASEASASASGICARLAHLALAAYRGHRRVISLISCHIM